MTTITEDHSAPAEDLDPEKMAKAAVEAADDAAIDFDVAELGLTDDGAFMTEVLANDALILGRDLLRAEISMTAARRASNKQQETEARDQVNRLKQQLAEIKRLCPEALKLVPVLAQLQAEAAKKAREA